jgi:flagellar basal-body rod protein FlgG
MQGRRRIALTVWLACAATLLAHFWLAHVYERRLERLVNGGGFETLLAGAEGSLLGSRVPRARIGPSEPDEVLKSLSTLAAAASPPRLLQSATYESEAVDSAADAHPPLARHGNDGRPLSPRDSESRSAVRDVIEQEMPGVSADERDIWFDELKSLPAEAVRDLLKVRRQMRLLSPDHRLAGPSPLFSEPPPHAPAEIVSAPIARSVIRSSNNWSATRAALRQAIAWSTHNLANAHTPGYKRLRVLMTDAYAEASADATEKHVLLPGAGCRIGSITLDADPAPITETGREFDVAIDGPGFFFVHHEATGRSYYTRYGAWKLTIDRRLALAIDNADYLLDRELRLPAAATEIRVAPNGEVRAANSDTDEPELCGRIQLASLAATAQLAPQGYGLFVARDELEPALGDPGIHGRGVLRQRALEDSNVDLEFEIAERERWQQLLDLIGEDELPRTAKLAAPLPK